MRIGIVGNRWAGVLISNLVEIGPTIEIYSWLSTQDLLKESNLKLDGLIIANSIEHRDELLNLIIDSGTKLPLYIEKPIATSVATLNKLTKYSEDNIIYTGHQDLVRPSMQKFKQLIHKTEILDTDILINHLDLTNNMWEWFPHIFGILEYLNIDSRMYETNYKNDSYKGDKLLIRLILNALKYKRIMVTTTNYSYSWFNNSVDESQITIWDRNGYKLSTETIYENAVKINLTKFINSIKYNDKEYLNNFNIAANSVAKIIKMTLGIENIKVDKLI